MKKILVAAVAVVLITLSSCSNGGSSYLGGTWSYKSVSYSAISAIGSTTASTLTGTGGSTSEVDNVIFRFASYPPAPGIYTIVYTPSNLAANEVYIITNIGTKGFTIQNTGSATANVSVSGTKVTVVVSSATFSNITGQTADSGPFTANITQNL